MEEEKKNNKGIIIGIIIFLVLCLIAIIYFIFKNVYVGPNNTPSELNETETNDTSEEKQVEFTELTKYTLEEGEEKQITYDKKTIKLSKKNNKYFLDDKEFVESRGIYITNQLIITYNTGQFGEIYEFYDFNLNKIQQEKNENCFIQYNNLRLENNKLLTSHLDNYDTNPEKKCDFGTYEIKYQNNIIKYELNK